MSLRIKIYYFIKPIIPRFIQIIMRRIRSSKYLLKYKSIWPINEKARQLPSNWHGWPNKKKFALILTHDVETIHGYKILNLF